MKRKLMFGDCLERMKEIPNDSIDMILTDPPYGTTACKWDSIISLDLLWIQIERLIKKNKAIIITASQPFTSILVLSNIYLFKYEWIWKKNAGSNFGALKYQLMKEHENILVFCNGGIKYYPQKQKRSESGKKMIILGIKSKPSKGNDVYGGLNYKGYDNSLNDKNLRCPSSVQNFKRERGLHPTQKPVALMEYLIKTYTLKNETVLDFTMGSGTTGVACKNLKRSFIGIENNKEYFRIAKQRIREA